MTAAEHLGGTTGERKGGVDGPVLRAAALATTAMFAGGGLLTQTVVVPLWWSADPRESLDSFAQLGPPTGATLFPLELTAVLLLSAVTVGAVRGHRPRRLAWAAALACMSATVVLLPVYFLPANAALQGRTIAPEDVAGALTSWYRWNWLRTGLAALAVAACCAGFGGRRLDLP